jgi:glucose-fructose oxidoreductase
MDNGENFENGNSNNQERSLISRRRILQGVLFGAVAAGIDLNPLRILAQTKGRKLGVVLLGLGRYSNGELGPALRETKLCSLVGVITGTPAKAEKWATDYNLDQKNIYNYETMDRIADNKDIDIVYVVTPPGLHPEFTIRAARAGKHVISEKPMATSVADCDRMIAACKAARVQLGLGYRLHYDPYHREMWRIAKTKEFGRFKTMKGDFGFVMRQPEHRTSKKLGGGGPLMDVGIYVVHAACMAAGGAPLYVTAHEEPKLNPELFNEVEETITFTLEFRQGEKCEGMASFNKGANQFRLDGDKGWIDFKPAFNYRGIRCETSRGPLNYPVIRQQSAQIDDFAECVLTGRRTRVPGELGRRDIQVLMAIYEAARTGKRVKVGAI